MSHLPTLIADLALILISASLITLLFKWLKQPLVLGYIIAGLLANLCNPRGRLVYPLADDASTYDAANIVALCPASTLHFLKIRKSC